MHYKHYSKVSNILLDGFSVCLRKLVVTKFDPLSVSLGARSFLWCASPAKNENVTYERFYFCETTLGKSIIRLKITTTKNMSCSPLIPTPNITAAHPILLILRLSEPLVLQPAHFWCYLLSYSHAARFSRTNLGNVLLAMKFGGRAAVGFF